MPAVLFASMILFFASCAAPLNSSVCKTDEFSGFGVGVHENEALSEAHSALARQINSSVKVTTERMVSQQVSNGKENLNSMYESKTTTESTLPNAHDARVLSVEQRAGKVSTVVCMARADAVKGFIERQRLVADSLDLVSHVLLNTVHPKRKNEAWHKAQMLWSEYARIQNLLENWGAKSLTSKIETMEKATDDYKSYCQNMKIYWEPEQKNDYSSMAFSILSKNLKLEKSACQGNGILLAYENSEPNCNYEFGIYNCSCKPSLSLLSCDGTEYLLLENTVESSHKKQELALEKMKDTLKSADFWGKWEKEIKEWSPKCE